MAKKYYAVAFGKEGSGVYTNWNQTEGNVKGVSGVKYKSFPGLEQAREFLLDLNVSETDIQLFYNESPPEVKTKIKKQENKHENKEVDIEAQKKKTLKQITNGLVTDEDGLEFNADELTKGQAKMSETVYAYVDGSFRQGYDAYGYGVVIVARGEVLKTFSGYGRRPEYVTMRNVAGEVLGAVKAMEYALSVGAHKLVLHFDYQGIESWAKGTWKRNNDLTRGYHEFTKNIQSKLELVFKKVKGHSGDPFNDLADELAKQGVLDSHRDSE